MTCPRLLDLLCPCGRQASVRERCWSCYQKARRDGTLDDLPRQTRRGADVIDDWCELRVQGYTRRLAAERLGMTLDALHQVISRANRRGDPRLDGDPTITGGGRPQPTRRTA